MEFLHWLYIFTKRRKFWIVGVAFALSFIGGLYIYRHVYGLDYMEAISYTLGLFAMNVEKPNNIEIENWQWIFTVSVFVKVSLILGIVLIFFRKIISSIVREVMIYKGGHTIVIGLGQNSRFFINSMLEKYPHRLLVFETDKENPYLERYRDKKLSVISKNVDDVIGDINLQECENIFISTGSDEQNIYYALEFLERLKGNENFNKLLLHIEDRTLRNLYSDKEALDAEGIDIKVFSFYKESARIVLQKEALDGEGDDILRSDKDFTVNIIGDGELSVSLVVEAFKLAHYPNQNHLHINIVAEDTTWLKEKIEYAFPEMKAIENIHLHYKNISPQKAEFYEEGREIWTAKNLKNVFYCYDEVPTNISIATRVANFTFLRQQERRTMIKFHIATMSHNKIAKEIERLKTTDLRVFAKAKEVCSYENLLDNNIDKIAKYINFDYHKEHNKRATITADELWRETLINDKKSSVGQAIHLQTKLRYLGLKIGKKSLKYSTELLIERNINVVEKALEEQPDFAEELERLTLAEHNRWMTLLRLMDYQYKNIPKSDKIQKLHPLLKPMDELTDEEIKKYTIYDANAILEMAKYVGMVGCELRQVQPKKSINKYKE